MDRRAFLRRLAGAVAAIAVAPTILDALAVAPPVAPAVLASCVTPLSAESIAELYIKPAVEALRRQIDDQCAHFAYHAVSPDA